jgi:hypothetical protein
MRKRYYLLSFPLNQLFSHHISESVCSVLFCSVLHTLLTYSVRQVAPRLSLSTNDGRLRCLNRSSESEGSVDKVHVIVNRLGRKGVQGKRGRPKKRKEE